MAVVIAHFENGGGFGGAITSFEEHIRYSPPECRHLVATSHSDPPTMAALRRTGSEIIQLPQYRRSGFVQSALKRVAPVPLLSRVVALTVSAGELLVRFVYGAAAAWKLRPLGVGAIHLNNGIYFNLEGIVAARLLGVPCLLTVRGLEHVQDGMVRMVSPRMTALLTHVFAVSAYVARQLIEWGMPPGRVTTVFETVDVNVCRQRALEPIPDTELEKPGTPVVVMVGCILPWKGHRVFIEAAGRIIQREGLRNCAFWIVGGAAPGTEEFLASLNERSRELGLQIRFLGHQDNVYKWLSHADVVVHASVEPEPFGRVIIEAMALGKPVIATQIGGPLEIVVNGRNGILVPPNEPDTLADAVARVLSDDEMRTRLQQGGIETVENTFSTARFQHTLRGVYRQAVPQLAGVAR